MDCVAHQAPLSLECPRQEYWSGLPFPPPGDLPNPGTEPPSASPALAGGFFTTATPGKPQIVSYWLLLKWLFFFNVDHFWSLYCFCLMFQVFDREACGILAPWLGMEPHTWCIGKQSLNHSTAREVPSYWLLILSFRKWSFCPRYTCM